MNDHIATRNEVSMADVDTLMRYEEGDLDDREILTFFAKLIETGVAWRLQGSYGRTARDLLDSGVLTVVSDPAEDSSPIVKIDWELAELDPEDPAGGYADYTVEDYLNGN